MRRYLHVALLVAATFPLSWAAHGQEPKEKSGDRPPEAGGRAKRSEPRPDDDSPRAKGVRGKGEDRGPMPPGGAGRGGPGMPGGPYREAPGANEIKRMAEEFLRQLDRNRDGKLNSTEWEGLTPDPLTIDKNADGEITVEELSAFPRWQFNGPGMRGFGGGFGGGEGRFGGGFGGGEGRFGGGFGGGMGMPGAMPGGYGGVMPGAMGGPGGQPLPDDPEMRELMKQDADLDREANDLANQVRRASGAERDKLKSQLADLVNKHFDARQKRRDLQLKRLQEELERLQSAISKRNESRESIVKNRIAELTGEPRDLEF